MTLFLCTLHCITNMSVIYTMELFNTAIWKKLLFKQCTVLALKCLLAFPTGLVSTKNCVVKPLSPVHTAQVSERLRDELIKVMETCDGLRGFGSIWFFCIHKIMKADQDTSSVILFKKILFYRNMFFWSLPQPTCRVRTILKFVLSKTVHCLSLKIFLILLSLYSYHINYV